MDITGVTAQRKDSRCGLSRPGGQRDALLRLRSKKDGKSQSGAPFNRCYTSVTIILFRDFGCKWRRDRRGGLVFDPCIGIYRVRASPERNFPVFEAGLRREESVAGWLRGPFSRSEPPEPRAKTKGAWRLAAFRLVDRGFRDELRCVLESPSTCARYERCGPKRNTCRKCHFRRLSTLSRPFKARPRPSCDLCHSFAFERQTTVRDHITHVTANSSAEGRNLVYASVPEYFSHRNCRYNDGTTSFRGKRSQSQ